MSVPVFPLLPGIAYPRPRAARWDTVKQDALSGKRTRYPLWTFPVYEYELTFSYLRSDANTAEWQALLGFINSVQGAAQLWAYSDPDDNSVSAQPFGSGDGVSTSFQLVRTIGGFTEPVFLVKGSPVVKVAGVTVTPASISPYGAVNFASPPAGGAALSWSGSYYWPCRFDEDLTSFSKFLVAIYELKSLKFSTEKLP